MAQAAQDPFAQYADAANPPPAATSPHDTPIHGDPFAQYADVKTAPPPSPYSGLGADPEMAFSRITGTKENMRMIGGGVGALALGAGAEAVGLIPAAAAGAGMLVRGGLALARSLPPVAGAYAGGAGTAVAQGAPPSEAHQAGVEQASYEALGQGVSWPLKSLARRALAYPIAQTAAKGLESARTAVNTQLDAVLSQAEAAVRGTREGVANAVGRAKDVARRAGSLVGLTEQSAAEESAKAAGHWPSTPPPPGANQAAGQAANDVIRGPAQHSLDQLGQAVDKAAQSGPPVDLTGVKGKLGTMGSKLQTSGEAEAAPGGNQITTKSGRGGFSPDQTTALLQQLKAQGIELEPSHPLPGVLGRIQAQPDSVPFSDAHILKRSLDEAVSWDSPARKQVQQITKGVRGELRGTMAGHEPYDQATEAYQNALPFFRQGSYAKQITKNAITNPEGLVTLIKGNQPTKLQMLHDVLIDHATAGGGEAEGQAAWNSVRSAWTYENLIKGGVEKFPDKLARLHPDFVNTMYGDAEGQQVIGNLKQISEAVQQAGVQGEAAVAGAKAGAQQATQTAQRTGEQGRIAVTARQRDAGAVREQVKAAKQPNTEEQAFAGSSLANTPPPTQLVSDAAHVALMHGANLWRVRSGVRAFLGGPKMNDLVQWAAYSGPKTQKLVRAVSGPAPGMMLTDLYRQYQMESGEPPMASHTQAPPPPASQAPPPPR
jgi:hypothetical protein